MGTIEMAPEHCLITGGTGSIGSDLADALVRATLLWSQRGLAA
jgi:nucleoside-diphosphate-sugar epimerase